MPNRPGDGPDDKKEPEELQDWFLSKDDEPEEPEYFDTPDVESVLPELAGFDSGADDGRRSEDDQPPSDPPKRETRIHFSQATLKFGFFGIAALAIALGLTQCLPDQTVEPPPATEALQEDVVATESTGPTQTEATESSAEVVTESIAGPSVTVPEGFAGVVITAADYAFDSHTFTLTVNGDGEALTMLDNLRWYQVLISGDTPSGSIDMDATFNTNGFRGRLRAADGSNLDAEITAEWLDSSTLRLTMQHPDYDTAATYLLFEILMRTEDDSGRNDYESSFELTP